MLHIVDDDAVLCDALVWLAKSRNIPGKSYGSAEQFLATLKNAEGAIAVLDSDAQTQFAFAAEGDCLLLDVRMLGMSGVGLFDILSAEQLNKCLPVIFLTGHGDVPMAVDALKRGAFDFFEKPFYDNALFERISEALVLSRQSGALAIMKQRLARLSLREREVLDLMLQGKLNKIIADELGISMRTVEVHRAHIFDKMRVKSALELANWLK